MILYLDLIMYKNTRELILGKIVSSNLLDTENWQIDY